MGQELINPGDDAKIATRVASLYSSIERDHHLRDALPAPIDKNTRKILEEYRRGLHARLRSISESVAERQTAGKAIGAFLLGYLNARSSDAPVTLATYVSTVNDQPLFAILQALDDFRHGRVFDIDPKDGSRTPFTIDHAPSAPRLLDQVKKRAAEVQGEKYKVTRLLAIDKVTEPEVAPEEKARVAEHMQRLAESLKIGRDKLRAAERERIRGEAQEARDRAAQIKQNATKRRMAQAG
jgi:hypothetical protein